jgi:hypothetical protein
MKEIVYSHSKIFLRPDGIVVIDVRDEGIIGKQIVEEIVNAVEKITGGKAAPNLILTRPGAMVDKEAREFSSSPRGMQFTVADAMVIHNLPQKVVANFYLRINRPEKPTRFFSDEEEAITWLKKFL